MAVPNKYNFNMQITLVLISRGREGERGGGRRQGACVCVCVCVCEVDNGKPFCTFFIVSGHITYMLNYGCDSTWAYYWGIGSHGK
jgi:hypothetical protein